MDTKAESNILAEHMFGCSPIDVGIVYLKQLSVEHGIPCLLSRQTLQVARLFSRSGTGGCAGNDENVYAEPEAGKDC